MSKLLRSMHRTWAEVFADVVVYPVRDGGENLDLTHLANVELFAAPARGVLPPRGGEATLVNEGGFPEAAGTVLDADLERLIEDRYVGELEHDDVPILTDDKAPVDSLMQVDGL